MVVTQLNIYMGVVFYFMVDLSVGDGRLFKCKVCGGEFFISETIGCENPKFNQTIRTCFDCLDKDLSVPVVKRKVFIQNNLFF